MSHKKMIQTSKIQLVFLIIASSLTFNTHAASSDEIQVYDDAINKPGEVGVELHMNYVPLGAKEISYPHEIPANHDFRLTPEFSYGINTNWEGGLYLPVIRSVNGKWYEEGAKVRLKFMGDHPQKGFYWGINNEFGYSSHRTVEHNWNYELRPIIGYKTQNWNLMVNPILDLAISGNDHTPDFAPAFKISRRIADKTWINIEHYSDFGLINNMRSHVQETYLTADTEVFGHDLNFGVGHGWTHLSNDWTLKAIFDVPF